MDQGCVNSDQRCSVALFGLRPEGSALVTVRETVRIYFNRGA